jgi:hypothetical protein
MTALEATCVLLGLWGLLAGAQWFADAAAWRTHGALGWDLLRLRRSRFWRSAVLARVFAVLPVRAMASGLVLASLAMIALPPGPAILPLLALFITATGLLVLRTTPDGASKMTLVSAYGAVLMAAGAASGERALVLAGVIWTGGHLTLSYAVAGWSKLTLANWRDGSALRKALNSYIWGHSLPAGLLRSNALAWTLAWALILGEALFPLALLAPPQVLAAALGIMFLFHLATALFMGLNTYPWGFAAAYPAVFALGAWLRGML